MKQKTKFKQTEIGMIPKNWTVVKQKDVARFINGRAYSYEEFRDAGTPIIRIQNLTGTKGFVYSDLQLEEEKYVEDGDLIYAWSATFGPYIWKGPKAIFHYHIWKILCDESKLDKSFFYYKLKYISDRVRDTGTGSIFTHITKKLMEDSLISLPIISEQKSIAKILLDLDSKIKLNQQMNKNLEMIGQTIFKHWFIDFEFPNEDNKPYKSSGGEIVYNEELEKEIPRGWTVTTLDQVAEFTRGFSYKGFEKSKADGEYAFVTLNSVKEFGGFKREFSYITSDRVKEKNFVRYGDIIIANTEQTKTGTLLGYPALVEFPFQYAKNEGVFSHHITKATPKLENLKHYLYRHLFIHQQNAVKYHTGSVIWALDVANWSKNERIILPSKEILKKFESLIENIFLKSLENNLQIETLSRIRDSLLPRLMSGKIRVPVEA